MELGNIYENTAWLYDYDNRDNLIDDIPFYKEYALKSGAEVLELGCGTGRGAFKLAEAGFSIEEEYGWYDKSGIKSGRELIFVCKRM